MKAIKSLLAVSVLVAAGATHAATIAPFTDTQSGTSSFATVVGTGTGSLNTTTGVLTLNGTGQFKDQLGLGVNIALTTQSIFNGTVSGTTWTPSGTGTYQFSNCPTATTIYCSLIPTAPQGVSGITGTVSLASGATSTVSSTLSMSIAGSAVNLAFTDVLKAPTTTPTVPVPAAAWLFGSGLLGLAGTARRRRS